MAYSVVRRNLPWGEGLQAKYTITISVLVINKKLFINLYIQM